MTEQERDERIEELNGWLDELEGDIAALQDRHAYFMRELAELQRKP